MIYYYWKIFIYFLIFYNSIINCERDFYQILGVKRDATLQDIKKAYRNLALKYHPDKSEDPDAEKKFIEVGNAYAILSDPEKRKLYDQFGEAGVNPQASQKQGGFSGTNFKTGTFNFHFGASDAFKIFEQFFGSKDGGFPGGGFASSNFPGGSFSNGRFPGGSFSNGGFPGGGFSSSNFQGKKPPNVRQNSQQKTPQEIYSRNKDINFLNSKNFDEFIKKNKIDNIILIQFFGTNSKSINFISEFEIIIKKLKNYIKIGVIDVDKEKEISNQYNIESTPTIILFSKNKYEKYEGSLDSKSIIQFVLSKLPSFVTGVRHSTFQQFIHSNPEIPKVLLFTSKLKTPPMYNQLAKQFKDKIHFGLVFHTDKELIKQFNIQSIPSILFFQTPHSEPILYNGVFELKLLEKFFNDLLKKKKDFSSITQLTKNNLKLCSQNSNICLIFFIQSTKSKDIGNIINKLETIYDGKFNIVWIDNKKQKLFKQLFTNDEKEGILIYKPKKQKFIWGNDKMIDSIEKIQNFLDKVISGDISWNNFDSELNPFDNLI